MASWDRGSVATTIEPSEASAHVAGMITAELLKTMRGAVVKAAGVLTGQAIDDVVQDAVVRILTHAETYDWTKGEFVSWACRIAANLARNWRKASANNGHESSCGGSDEASYDESSDLVDTLIGSDGRHDVSRASDLSWLAAAMETLAADERMFLNNIADGMGQTEAGATLGWSPATSTRRYRSIVAKLADEA
jgi:RNA polymerase sigma factor (sigma-70 family)